MVNVAQDAMLGDGGGETVLQPRTHDDHVLGDRGTSSGCSPLTRGALTLQNVLLPAALLLDGARK